MPIEWVWDRPVQRRSCGSASRAVHNKIRGHQECGHGRCVLILVKLEISFRVLTKYEESDAGIQPWLQQRCFYLLWFRSDESYQRLVFDPAADMQCLFGRQFADNWRCPIHAVGNMLRYIVATSVILSRAVEGTCSPTCLIRNCFQLLDQSDIDWVCL
jgi:hypothetical protein